MENTTTFSRIGTKSELCGKRVKALAWPAPGILGTIVRNTPGSSLIKVQYDGLKNVCATGLSSVEFV